MTASDRLEPAYAIHTNRELEFMLTRGKPLAHFSDMYPPEPDEEMIPRRAFEPHVVSGALEMREFVQLLPERLPQAPQIQGTLHVFYARRNEGWRIDAYIAMLAAAQKTGWHEGFERLEGALLGYTDAQNDAHIERMARNPRARDFPWLRTFLATRGK